VPESQSSPRSDLPLREHLEGLLFAVAEKNPKDYNQAKAAPSKDGKVKPLGDWTLQNLIAVSRELGLIGRRR